MKTKHDIANKEKLVKGAHTAGAEPVADSFWAEVLRNISVLSGEIKPSDVTPRKTRTV